MIPGNGYALVWLDARSSHLDDQLASAADSPLVAVAGVRKEALRECRGVEREVRRWYLPVVVERVSLDSRVQVDYMVTLPFLEEALVIDA